MLVGFVAETVLPVYLKVDHDVTDTPIMYIILCILRDALW